MRFSIIIPNFNYGAYIGEAIKSALALDWPNLEVIVVDDGSTDNSAEVIRSFGGAIKAVFQENASQRVACNVGFALATGAAIIFLDSDDMVAPSLAREVARVWRPDVSKVQVQMMRIDNAGAPLNSVFPDYDPKITAARIRTWASRTTAHPTPPGSGNVYARWFLEKLFPLDGSCGAFSDSACLAAAPFLGAVETLRAPLVSYRVHGKNDSNLFNDTTRFAREINRGVARYDYSRRFLEHQPQHPVSPICASLPILQFRIASLKLHPDQHPLKGDSLFRAFCDLFWVPWRFSYARLRDRWIIFGWGVLTVLSPKRLARKLIAVRYRAA